MRDLTPEELELAPDWATHYYTYNDGDILFECNIMYQYYDAKKKEFHEPLSCSHVSDESVKIIRKPFDITQHEWSDGDIESSFITNDKQRLNFNFDSSVMPMDIIGFNRDDIIAIAKHFKLTAEDLK